MVERVYIYALRCPDTNEVRYIGKANNAKTRFAAHLWASKNKGSFPVNRWIRKLAESGKTPVQTIEKESTLDAWAKDESELIASHRHSGKLLNITSGGDGCQGITFEDSPDAFVVKKVLNALSNRANGQKRSKDSPELVAFMRKTIEVWSDFYKREPKAATEFVLNDPLIRTYAGV